MGPNARVTQLSTPTLRLMTQHVDALFTHDAEDRLLAANSVEGGAAPRFFLGRTRDGCLWRFGAGLSSDTARELERVARRETAIESDDDRMPAGRDDYIRILAADSELQKVSAGPCYTQTTSSGSRATPRPAHDIRRIDESNVELLRDHLPDWLDVALLWQPLVVALDRGEAVSVCGSVRRTDEAHEAGVDTSPAFRRRGFARSAVAGWLEAVNQLGLEPLYSTSWENEASQRLARTLGLTLFGVNFHVT